jgi:hypothetical protein
MWYNSQPMARRRITLTLLALIAVQLLGSMAFAAVCLEPCPDDTEETSCPPVCAICTTCTHAQQAIVHAVVTSAPHPIAPHAFHEQAHGSSSQRTDDIFHVPLAV